MTWVFALLTVSGFSFIFWASMGIFRFVLERVLYIRNRDIKAVNITLSATKEADWDEMTVSYKPSRKSARNGMPITTWKDADGKTHYSSPEFALPINLTNVPLRSIRVEYGRGPQAVTLDKVAAIVPAHNEEFTIADTIANLVNALPPSQIYIASDGSKDKTVEIARGFGCNVADIQPNRGKAGAITYTLHHFNILDRYEAVLILDADSTLGPDYMRNALPCFDDPDIVAVAAHGVTQWKSHIFPRWHNFFTAYRIRLYRFLQIGMKYGQTLKHANVTAIIPGFASMYRTSALRHIDIDAPGLIIEDFNMTFEVHHKKLGKIAYHPKIYGVSHDPFTLRDYIKQVKRWNLGYWQTVKRHGIWPSLFWLSNGIFLLEMISVCFTILLSPFLILWIALNGLDPVTLPFVHAEITWRSLFFGLFVTDYCMTIVAAIVERKPVLMAYGFGFYFLRILDGALYLYSIPQAFFVKSSGRWVSPQRKLQTA